MISPKEELKNSDEFRSMNKQKSDSTSKDSKQDDEEMSFRKPKLTNKERARKARQRKKKYYEDLEKRAEYLEKKVVELNKELDFCRQKIQVFEGQRNPLSTPQTSFQSWLMDECINMLKTMPENSKFMETCSRITDSYGPYGTERVKILNNAFDSIMENILWAGSKIVFYILDKDKPSTVSEFDNYWKLKKFEKFEKYPDPFVRKWFDSRSVMNLTRSQADHFYSNIFTKFAELKDEYLKAIQMLFEAKERLYKVLMMHDMFKRNFMSKSITKDQYLALFKDMKEWDVKLSYEQIFNIQKRNIDIDVSIDIPDPEGYAKVCSIWEKKPENTQPQRFINHTYNMTTIKCC